MNGNVIFEDDFSSLDTSKWKHEVSMYGGGNNEFQMYTNDHKNVFIRDHQLYIKPTLTVKDDRFAGENFLKSGRINMKEVFGTCTEDSNYGNEREGRYGFLPPVMSGKLKSVATLRYGTVEVRARIPKGDWIWPAIWMLPKDNKYGEWPMSGEIDIMESRGNEEEHGVGTVISTLHWGPSVTENQFELTSREKKTESWHNDFHTWKLEKTPDYIATYIDGAEILRVQPDSGGFWKKGGFNGDTIWKDGNKMAPFDQEFYLILNVAVGGTNGFFSERLFPHKQWKNTQSHSEASESFWDRRDDWLPTWCGDDVAMIVDYVKFEKFS